MRAQLAATLIEKDALLTKYEQLHKELEEIREKEVEHGVRVMEMLGAPPRDLPQLRAVLEGVKAEFEKSDPLFQTKKKLMALRHGVERAVDDPAFCNPSWLRRLLRDNPTPDASS